MSWSSVHLFTLSSIQIFFYLSVELVICSHLLAGVRDLGLPAGRKELAVQGAVEVQDGVHDNGSLELRPSALL